MNLPVNLLEPSHQAQQFCLGTPLTGVLATASDTSRNLGHSLQLETWMAACSLGNSVWVTALAPVGVNTTEDIAFC